MDPRDRRPPRSVPPRNSTAPSHPQYQQQYQHSNLPPSYADTPERPPVRPTGGNANPGSRGNVSFQANERGDRSGPVPTDANNRQRHSTSYQQNPLPPTPSDVENGFEAKVSRKKSLVRPDREKIEPGHRQWHYRNHAAQLEDESKGKGGLFPSSQFCNALFCSLEPRLISLSH